MKSTSQLLPVISLMLLLSCSNKSSEKKMGEDSLTTQGPEVKGPDRPTIGTVEVPMGIKKSFDEKYPQASNIKWTRPDTNTMFDWEMTDWPRPDSSSFAASFNWDNADYWAWYDSAGTWIGAVNNISDYGSLPKPVNFEINKEFKGYTITSVKRENDKNRTAFEIVIENGDDHGKLLIDENGKVLKQKMTVNGQTTKKKNNPKDSK